MKTKSISVSKRNEPERIQDMIKLVESKQITTSVTDVALSQTVQELQGAGYAIFSPGRCESGFKSKHAEAMAIAASEALLHSAMG